MAIGTYNIKVADVIRETEDAISIAFDIPENLKDLFEYRHGQFLTFKMLFDGKIEKRAYSLSSSPYSDSKPVVTIKKVEGGVVSNYLVENLKPGDNLDVMPPRGKFTIPLDEMNEKLYVVFGGGSGITPLISIIKAILLVEKKSNVILFYANHNEDTIIFKNELNKLEDKFENLKVINVLSHPNNGWIGLVGRIDEVKCKMLLDNYVGNKISKSEYFICGHPGMMKAVISTLTELNIPKSQIHKESYASAIAEENENNTSNKVEDTPPPDENVEVIARKVVIKLYGETNEVIVEPDETLLLAAMRKGYDPPFSCQIGACATCRAKILSGKVTMDEREALTDEEIEEGYILTCQSHPLTDNVVVDYDEQ